MRTVFVVIFTILGLLALLSAQEDVMSVYDQVRQLDREFEVEGIKFCREKEPTLQTIPLSALDQFVRDYPGNPLPEEVRDRIAFEYRWKKGMIRPVGSRVTMDVRNVVDEDEVREITREHPEFATLKEKERGGFFSGYSEDLPEPQAKDLLAKYSQCRLGFGREIGSMQMPILRKILRAEYSLIQMVSGTKAAE